MGIIESEIDKIDKLDDLTDQHILNIFKIFEKDTGRKPDRNQEVYHFTVVFDSKKDDSVSDKINKDTIEPLCDVCNYDHAKKGYITDVIDEFWANAIKHAGDNYDGDKEMLPIKMKYVACSDLVLVEFEDQGAGFDPSKYIAKKIVISDDNPEAKVKALDDVEIGGLGTFFTSKFASKMYWKRDTIEEGKGFKIGAVYYLPCIKEIIQPEELIIPDTFITSD